LVYYDLMHLKFGKLQNPLKTYKIMITNLGILGDKINQNKILKIFNKENGHKKQLI